MEGRSGGAEAWDGGQLSQPPQGLARRPPLGTHEEKVVDESGCPDDHPECGGRIACKRDDTVIAHRFDGEGGAHRRPLIVGRRGHRSGRIQLNHTRPKCSLTAAIADNCEEVRALTRWVGRALPLDHAARWVGVGEEAQTGFEGALRGKVEGDSAGELCHGQEQPR